MGMANRVAVATDWRHALRRACAGEGLEAVYQPLVDLQRGQLAGYEALVRFTLLDDVGPEEWFARARAHHCEGELEAAVLATTLAARPDLPRNLFLSVNVSPTAIADEPVVEQLDRAGDLRGLVLELTEHSPVPDFTELGRHLDRHRDRGALVALDDAGSGYAGLTHMLQLRPSIVKLDRTLVSDIDRDDAKRILVEMLGIYAGRLDAWVMAEGIETRAELETVRGLGVPLGQGWALGHPARPWATLDDEVRHALRRAPAPRADPTISIGGLSDPAETVPVGERDRAMSDAVDRSADAFVVLVDEQRKPVGTVTPAGARTASVGPVLAVSVSTPVTDLAHRALTRACEHRFEPAVCTDPAGRVVGVVRIERVVEALAEAAALRR